MDERVRCPKCGGANNPSWTFCDRCGTRLRRSDAPDEEVEFVYEPERPVDRRPELAPTFEPPELDLARLDPDPPAPKSSPAFYEFPALLEEPLPEEVDWGPSDEEKRGLAGFVRSKKRPALARVAVAIVLLPFWLSSEFFQWSEPLRIRLAGIACIWIAIFGAVVFFVSRSPEPAAGPITTTSPTVAPVNVSEECANGLLFARAHRADPQGATYLKRTADLCATAAEWLSAVRRHPDAVGLASAAQVTDGVVGYVCRDEKAAPRSRVCRDAASRGLLR